jgi:hypothetical protein
MQQSELGAWEATMGDKREQAHVECVYSAPLDISATCFAPKGIFSDFLEKKTSEKDVFYIEISFFPMIIHFFNRNPNKFSVPRLDFEPIKLSQTWHLVHLLIRKTGKQATALQCKARKQGKVPVVPLVYHLLPLI